MPQPNLLDTPATDTTSTLAVTNKHLADNNATSTLLSTFADPRKLEAALTRIQNELHQYDEDRLIEFAINAEALERCAFLVRGMIAYELQSRISQRLTGGRGHKDRARIGIKSKMYELAERVKVNYKTLASDARIYKTFFADKDKSSLAGETTLPRDFYLTALGLSGIGEEKPHEAIRVAMQQCAKGQYSREDFREHVRNIAGGVSINITAANKEKDYVLKERVTIKTRTALAKLIKATNKTSAQVIEEAILAQLKSVESKSENSAQILNL